MTIPEKDKINLSIKYSRSPKTNGKNETRKLLFAILSNMAD
jgi:hypothetical protein